MAAELLGLSTGFDEAFCAKNILEEMLGHEIPLQAREVLSQESSIVHT